MDAVEIGNSVAWEVADPQAQVMTLELPPIHDDLSFNSPLSETRAADLVAFIGSLASGRIVDIGCGWAELLLRAVETTPRASGLGIDLRAEAILRGRANAEARGLAERVELVVADASTEAPGTADAAICLGASQVWGDHISALTALRAMVPAGGRVLYGDAVWIKDPTAAALKALDAIPSDYGTLADLVDVAVSRRFHPLRIGQATTEEWDTFESGYSWGFERWLMSHPDDHHDAAKVREMAADHRRKWLRGYREILGFGFLSLIAD